MNTSNDICTLNIKTLNSSSEVEQLYIHILALCPVSGCVSPSIVKNLRWRMPYAINWSWEQSSLELYDTLTTDLTDSDSIHW